MDGGHQPAETLWRDKEEPLRFNRRRPEARGRNSQ